MTVSTTVFALLEVLLGWVFHCLSKKKNERKQRSTKKKINKTQRINKKSDNKMNKPKLISAK